MKRSYNYTGRYTLESSAVRIDLFEKENSASEFQLDIKTDGVKIPGDSGIWVEAYRGPHAMRFRMGTWAAPVLGVNHSLDNFRTAEPVLFRVKVVDESDPRHPIKAWKDQIRPNVIDRTGKKRRSILPVYPTNCLGHITWQVNWDDLSRPILYVNSRISEARDITSIVKNDPDFAALVFPEVLSQILHNFLSPENFDDDGENDGEWLKFGSELVGCGFSFDEDGSEDRDEQVTSWVSKAVQAFSGDLGLIRRYIDFKSI